MKTKYFFNSIVLIFSIIGIAVLVNGVLAQNIDVQYPVAELDNCQNEKACKVYCDQLENIEACLNFAQKNNLMSPEEIQIAKNFAEAGGESPGKCVGKEECEEYCNDISHIDECVTFAEQNNLLPPEQLEEVKKVKEAIAKGIKPPSCGNKKACDEYCDNPDHTEECITFAEAAGFLQGKELEDAKKMLQALKRGVKPPPCRGKEACDKYCSDPNNMELCMNFALEAGFMTEQEKADSQKMLQALKKGIKPPKCRGKEECDVYCSQEEHFEECVNFSEAAGFMTAEEAAMARKTKGKGPGNCKNKDECEAFCNNLDNQEACFNFAKENGLISEQDLKQMEEGKQKMRDSLDKAPPEVLDCLNSTLGTEMMEKFKSGSAMPPREIGDQMRTCYEKMGPMQPEAPGEGDMMSPGGQVGPGDCKTPEECKSFCETNPEECKNFGPGPGTEGMTSGSPPSGEFQPGPNGCQTPEECQGIMPPPNVCQGENCQPFPSQNQIQPYQQQPPEGQRPPEGQQPPMDNLPPSYQNPPGFQQPPSNQFPPAGQQPLPNEPLSPSPLNENPTVPSSFLDPDFLLGLVVSFFIKAFGQ